MRGFTIAKVMATIRLGLQNARKCPTIKTGIRAFGYDENRMKEGDALYREVERLRFVYQIKRDDALCAHEAWKDKAAEAKRLYIKHLKLARRSLDDCRYHWNTLDMKGRRGYAFGAWTEQARRFYHGALAHEDILSRLKESYDITTEKLEQGLALIEEAIASRESLIRLQAESKVARVEWDNGLGRLKKWYYMFRLILRTVFERIPEYLVSVGLRSKRKARPGKVYPLVEAFGLATLPYSTAPPYS